jgi:hypothetical protein
LSARSQITSQSCEARVTADQVLALDTLGKGDRQKVFSARSRSLSRGARSARCCSNSGGRKTRPRTRRIAHEAKKKKKGAAVDPNQLDFYEDMLRPIGEIEALFDTKSFVEKTDKAFWLGIAQKLEAQADRARKLAKEMAT